MHAELISVRDVAAHHGKRKQTIFKILKRLGIETKKRRSTSGKNQFVAYITQDELKIVRRELLSIREGRTAGSHAVEIETLAEQGVFYLMQLEPVFDPGRFKVGFATSLPERLRHLRCSAPFATVIRFWACQRLWEKTAIDAISAGCERLHTEVFRTSSLEEVAAKCEQFFAIMPPVPLRSSNHTEFDPACQLEVMRPVEECCKLDPIVEQQVAEGHLSEGWTDDRSSD